MKSYVYKYNNKDLTKRLVTIAIILFFSTNVSAIDNCLVHKYSNNKKGVAIFGPGITTNCSNSNLERRGNGLDRWVIGDIGSTVCNNSLIETAVLSCRVKNTECTCLMYEKRFDLANESLVKNLSNQLDTQITQLKMEQINAWSMQLAMIQNDVKNIQNSFGKLSKVDNGELFSIEENISLLNDSILIIYEKISQLKKELNIPEITEDGN